MKIRGSFVTNSSSSNFVIFGKSREDILRMIKEYEIFGEINDIVLKSLERKQPLEGAALQNFYDNEIMYMMKYVRERMRERLDEDAPFDWLYSTDPSHYISREASLISEQYLKEMVAFSIELEDIYGNESFGWKAVGFHHDEKTCEYDDMILVIGINKH